MATLWSIHGCKQQAYFYECQVEKLEMFPKGNGEPWSVCEQGREIIRSLSLGPEWRMEPREEAGLASRWDKRDLGYDYEGERKPIRGRCRKNGQDVKTI